MSQVTLKYQEQTVEYFTEDLGQKIGLEMIWVPRGNFMMGSPEKEPERDDSEGPQHHVTVPSFFMGRYPITQAQWKTVAAWEPIKLTLESAPSSCEGDDRPVDQIAWHEAVEFCQRLSQKTGREYRLPSEAEWEYVCRASTTTPFSYGKTLSTDLANYNGEFHYAEGPTGRYRGETTPVGHFPPNSFGFCDLHGNVDEWCQDHWHENYEGAPTDGAAWLETALNKELHVLRGGAWYCMPGSCRSASRTGLDSSIRSGNDYFGFRVVCGTPRSLASLKELSGPLSITSATLSNVN